MPAKKRPAAGPPEDRFKGSFLELQLLEAFSCAGAARSACSWKRKRADSPAHLAERSDGQEPGSHGLMDGQSRSVPPVGHGAGGRSLSIHGLGGHAFQLYVGSAAMGWEVVRDIAARLGRPAGSLLLTSGGSMLDLHQALLQQVADDDVTYVARSFGAGCAVSSFQKALVGKPLNEADACAFDEVSETGLQQSACSCGSWCHGAEELHKPIRAGAARERGQDIFAEEAVAYYRSRTLFTWFVFFLMGLSGAVFGDVSHLVRRHYVEPCLPRARVSDETSRR
ncbi:ccrn4l [Symbiodinium natans]|uniref:Ccrn4l protein n=1 Tax=Symbiodinium natans TaxID=878477 RepID=A0A812RV89_9DINO|nr:ccrn4l [Symbiodinium natans]